MAMEIEVVARSTKPPTPAKGSLMFGRKRRQAREAARAELDRDMLEALRAASAGTAAALTAIGKLHAEVGILRADIQKRPLPGPHRPRGPDKKPRKRAKRRSQTARPTAPGPTTAPGQSGD
jgi:hypothetical protein